MTTEADFDRMLWRWFLIGGLITIGIGAVLAFYPDLAITAIGWLVGLQFLVVGAAFLLGRAITGENIGQVMLGVLLGALGIWVGLVAFRNPEGVVAVLTFIIGAGWFISGVVEAVDGIVDRDRNGRGWVVAMGLVSVAAGLVLLFYPVESARTLAVFTGIVMLVLGTFRVVGAFQLKRALGA